MTIRIRPQSAGRRKSDSVIIYDGKRGSNIQPGDEIKVHKAEEVTPFIKTRKVSFAKILKEKLR